jgi:hypothetical protein
MHVAEHDFPCMPDNTPTGAYMIRAQHAPSRKKWKNIALAVAPR